MKRSIVSVSTALLLAFCAVPAVAGTKTILVKDNLFSPKIVTINSGSTLKYKWVGQAPHNVIASGAGKFRSETKTTGTYSKKLTKRGKYTIVCSIHPEMTMKATVK